MLMLLSLAVPMVLIGAIADSDGDTDSLNELDGTEGADTLEGTTGSDFIRAQGGDDLLQGRAGNDTLLGFEGDDVLEGADGDDMLCSGDDNDVVVGNRGADTLEGQGGDDFVSGDYGNDVVHGNEGNDTVLGGRGVDFLAGGDGDDVLFGGIVQGVPLGVEQLEELRDGASLLKILSGNGDSFNMREDGFQDELRGGQGDDSLFIGSADAAYGGLGADTFNLMEEHLRDGNAAVIHDFAPDRDAITVVVSDGSDVEVTVEENNGDAIIRGNGEFLARVTGAAGNLDVSDVALISEATVASQFDMNTIAT